MAEVASGVAAAGVPDGHGAARRDAIAPGFMVASSHRLVSSAGADVLRAGGTAGDAVLAMAAMSFVTLPGQCGVGGDTFCVWYDAARARYGAVQGSGVGPDGSDVGFFAARGLGEIPLHGPLAVTVPGTMAAIETLRRETATRPLPELWAPAVAAAADGVPVTDKTRRDVTQELEKLRADAAARTVFLPDGELPEIGATLRQRDLSVALARLAADPRDLYEGDLGTRCVGALRAAGAPFSGNEWRLARAPATTTISAPYRGHSVHTAAVPSPGYMVLQQAAILDGLLSELEWLGGRALHLFAGAAAHAFSERRRLVGADTDAWRELLDPRAVGAARDAVRGGNVPGVFAPVRAGDTTSFVAVDAAGNAVSYIHSLAFTFGSGFMVPGTGIVMNDRLARGAYLDPTHPNGLQPGRRPMHTLVAWIVAAPTGRPAFVGNTPGGDGQVQWNMQLLSHLLDHGLGPQEAVEAPRFSVFPGSDADTLDDAPEIRCESRLSGAVLDELRAAGASVVVQGPWEGGGSGQVVAIDPASGERRGGSDPRFDGEAVGG